MNGKKPLWKQIHDIKTDIEYYQFKVRQTQKWIKTLEGRLKKLRKKLKK